MAVGIKVNGKKGQSLVETALVLPIVVLILTGIIDFGLLFNNYLVLNNASREGARNAAVGMNDIQIINIIRNAASTLDQTKVSISIYPAESLRKKGDQVTVTVTFDNILLTPVVGAIVPNPVRLKAKTVMRME